MRQYPIPYLLFVFIITSSISLLSCSRSEQQDKTPYDAILASENAVVPDVIRLPENPPKGNLRVTTLYAEGVQKYKAQVKAGSSPVSYEWVFVAPQADLFTIYNTKVGTHSAGPTWQLSVNDSIYGQAYNPPKSAPAPDGTSIDWLSLTTKTGTVGTGVFSGVSYIQRIATVGGKAPSTPPTDINQTIEVKYSAVYRFCKKKL